MVNRKTISRFYPLLLVLAVFIVWKYRQSQKPPEQTESIDISFYFKKVRIKGKTMGTIQYNITYLHKDSIVLTTEIDELLTSWNEVLSTYISESEISQFNRDSCLKFNSKYFLPVLVKSKEIFNATDGAFDPTVGPLVNQWGFGPENLEFPDSTTIDSLKMLVGFEKISFDKNGVCKTASGVQLDFSAIAKGYAVDVVADFLEESNIENYLVEIGGEIVCSGLTEFGKEWRTGIENPKVAMNRQELFAIAEFTDRALATSGNYRNYYEKNGITYSHTIDPSTGYPARRNILSASVFAPDCMTADAYATAFMVMGVENAKNVLKKQSQLDAFLIFTDKNGNLTTWATDSITKKIQIVHDN